MATKSAGIPSDVASSASPRYFRTFEPCSTSRSSRQSRIASAISVGVRSSSPAPSATALTNAMAFRIRPAGHVSGARGLAGSDHDSAIRLLADARAADVGIVLKGEVDGAALKRLHGVERDRVAGHLHLARRPEGDLAHRVLAPLTVAFHVDDNALALREILAEHDVGDRLQGAQGLAPPPDQPTQVAAADIEGDRVGACPDGDLCTDSHVLEQSFHQCARGFRLAIRGRCRTLRRRPLVDHNDLHQRLLGTLADDAHIHVPTAFAQLDQSRVDSFVEGAAAAFSRSHRASTPLRISAFTIFLTSCAFWIRLRVAETVSARAWIRSSGRPRPWARRPAPALPHRVSAGGFPTRPRSTEE